MRTYRLRDALALYAVLVAIAFIGGCAAMEPFRHGDERWNNYTKDNTNRWSP